MRNLNHLERLYKLAFIVNKLKFFLSIFFIKEAQGTKAQIFAFTLLT